MIQRPGIKMLDAGCWMLDAGQECRIAGARSRPRVPRKRPNPRKTPPPRGAGQDSATVTATEAATEADQDPRKTPPKRGAGYVIVLEPPSGAATRCAQWRYRAPSGSAMRSAVPATRQAAGVPSAWSQPFQSTHVRPRRWYDAGPLRRIGVTAAQKAGTAGAAVEAVSATEAARSANRQAHRAESPPTMPPP